MKKFLVLTAVMILMASTAAFADSVTVTGIDTVNHIITFSVINTQTNITSVGSGAISGFFFNCTGCSLSTGTNTGSGALANVGDGGALTAVAPAVNNGGWNLIDFSGNTYFYSIFGSTAPIHTILSTSISCPSNGGSICNNNAHNPFFITGSGWSSAITFGVNYTNLGDLHVGSTGTAFYGTVGPTTVNQTPEPASMFLLGTGLLGIGGAIRRKIRL